MSSKEEDESSSTVNVAIESFDGMGLKQELLRGVFAYGFERPSEVQKRGIPAIIGKRDSIIQAQAGSGKTGVFCIAALQLVESNVSSPQALILAPTRELAEQTHRVMTAVGDYMKLNFHLCVGGTKVADDIRRFRSDGGVHVVIGTAGRVVQMVRDHHLETKYLRLVVLDEADEMLSRGFYDQMMDLFQFVPQNIQVCLVSATMPQEVLRLAERFMRDPVKILVKKEQLTLEGMQQFYVDVAKEEHKFSTLCDLYETLSVTQSIIFCNSKRRVETLAKRMNEHDFTVSYIHGEMEASERMRIIREFRSGSSRVMIATNIVARGIDVQQIELVVNYDLPLHKDIDSYIHRVGRSTRFGRKGIAISFVSQEDIHTLREIETYYNTQIKELPQDIATYLRH